MYPKLIWWVKILLFCALSVRIHVYNHYNFFAVTFPLFLAEGTLGETLLLSLLGIDTPSRLTLGLTDITDESIESQVL